MPLLLLRQELLSLPLLLMLPLTSLLKKQLLPILLLFVLLLLSALLPPPLYLLLLSLQLLAIQVSTLPLLQLLGTVVAIPITTEFGDSFMKRANAILFDAPPPNYIKTADNVSRCCGNARPTVFVKPLSFMIHPSRLCSKRPSSAHQALHDKNEMIIIFCSSCDHATNSANDRSEEGTQGGLKLLWKVVEQLSP